MTERSPELRHYARVIGRSGWLIAAMVAVAIGVAAALTFPQKPVYRASMQVVVGQGGGIFQPQFGGTVQPFVDTMARLFTSDVVAGTTRTALGLRASSRQLLASTQVSTTADSSVIGVTYDSHNRSRAVRVLAEMGTVFAQLVSQKLGAGLKPESKISATVFDPAHLEPGQVSPRPGRSLGIAAALGLAIGVILAFVRDGLDSRIRTRSEAERWFGAPVLATIPLVNQAPVQVNGSTPARLPAAVGMVRASLEYLGGGAAGQVITVTSALAREGKSTFVANLAIDLARAGSEVICVEADLRRPRLCEYLLQSSPERGLADVLASRVNLEDVIVDGPRPAGSHAPGSACRLRIVPAGHTEANPADLLTAARVEQLAADLRERADYVIFDTPSLLDVGDAFPFARVSHMVVVVAHEDRTTRERAEAVQATLQRLDVRRVGLVLVGKSTDAAYEYA